MQTNLSTGIFRYKYAVISTKQHLKDSNMGYWYHLAHSWANGFRLLVLAGTSFVHGVLPGIWPQHAARGVVRIYNSMRQYRHLRRIMREH